MASTTATAPTPYAQAVAALRGAGYVVTPAPSNAYAKVATATGAKVAVVHAPGNAYVAYLAPNASVARVAKATGGKPRKAGRTHTFVDVRGQGFSLATFAKHVGTYAPK